MPIYPPSDDSIFFSEFLKKYFSKLKNKNISYLDMGTGSGILSETAKNSGIKNILAVDIDKESVDFASKKAFKSIQSNLFSKIKNQKFDIITFNPPYLPAHKYDKKPDTAGGKKGDETALEFLNQTKNYLTENGKIFLLISSYTPQQKIKKFNPKIVAIKKLFFEELKILKFSPFV